MKMPKRLQERRDKMCSEFKEDIAKDNSNDAWAARYGFNAGFNCCWEELIPLVEALEFTLHCTEQLTWVKEGPKDITNPMFLGTGTVEGDRDVHKKYLKACEVLAEMIGRQLLDT